MTSDLKNTVDAEDVDEVITDVWESQLGLTLTRGPRREDARPVWWSRVLLTGAWTGWVAVVADRGLVDLVASAMFARDIGDLTDADRRDSLAEMANITGGNFKSLMRGTERLSSPESGTAEGWTEPSADLEFNYRAASDGWLGVVVSVEPWPSGG